MANFQKFDLVTEGTNDRKIGTVAAVREAKEANPLYLVTWHKRADRKYPTPSAEWIRAEYLYRYTPRVA